MATVERKYLTPAQAAEYLGISVDTLANWRGNQVGPAYVKLSKRAVRYQTVVLDAYMDERTRGAA
jgi:hypothetical protein